MTALLAVVVVLLAIGVGILIGNSGTSISQPLKVQVTGGSLSTGAGAGKAVSSGPTKSGSSGAKNTSTTPGNAFSSGS